MSSADSAPGDRRLVEDVVGALERRWPPALAEEWDNVGLAVGSRRAAVSSVLFAVDVTPAVIAEAAEVGAELIVAHHPLLLRGVDSVTDAHPKGTSVLAAVAAGVAIYCAHTNADKPAGGVSDALATLLGLVDARPLLPDAVERDKLVLFAPSTSAEAIRAALADAGAGAIGDYDSCSFSSPGEGRFRPLPGASPPVGRRPDTIEDASLEVVEEVRIEAILARGDRDRVLAAALAAHPYQTPAYDVIALADVPSADCGLGRVGALAEPSTAGAFAQRVADRLPATAGGVRLSGDPGRDVRTVALLGGAGDSLLAEARRSGADVYLTSDLRHHPAGEAIEWPGAPALIDVAHWAAEWAWLPGAAEALRADLPGLTVRVSTLNTDPWTARYARGAAEPGSA